MSSFRGITFCLQDDVVSVRSCFGSGERSWEQNLLRSRDLTLTVNYASDLGGNCAVTFLAILFLLQRAFTCEGTTCGEDQEGVILRLNDRTICIFAASCFLVNGLSYLCTDEDALDELEAEWRSPFRLFRFGPPLLTLTSRENSVSMRSSTSPSSSEELSETALATSAGFVLIL